MTDTNRDNEAHKPCSGCHWHGSLPSLFVADINLARDTENILTWSCAAWLSLVECAFVEGWSRIIPINNTIVLPRCSWSIASVWHHKVTDCLTVELVVVWLSGNSNVYVSIVTVTVCILVYNQPPGPTQLGHSSVDSCNECWWWSLHTAQMC